MRSALASVRPGPGRPKKFARPSRPVTVTLPEDTLLRLGAIDADLGRAIVALTERQRVQVSSTRPLAEVASYGTHAVIVVTPVKALKRIAGVELVPIGNGRALISLAHPHSIAELELGIRDALDRRDLTPLDRRALVSVADLLREARGSRRITLEERMIIVLEAKKRRHE
jgi:hypothetical protein